MQGIATKGSWALRKFEVQSYLIFHSLLGNWRNTEKLLTDQDKECSAFILSIQG